MLVQLDRLVKEFIVPLEKQINSEKEEKQVSEKETQEIVGQKRRSRTGKSKTSTSNASTECVAAGGTRRSKRVKVAPTRYDPVVEEESWTSSSHASSGVVTMHTTLTAAPRPLENSIATDETTMNGSNEDMNIGSSRRASAVAPATMVHKRRKVHKTFDERFKDLMAFKAEFRHCNVPQTKTKSSNNKYYSLGQWCNKMRMSYKSIKEGGITRNNKLSKANMKRLENAGFEWNHCKTLTFDERFKDLMAFKAEFGHCKVPQTRSRNSKYYSLAMWCSNMRRCYKKADSIQDGKSPRHMLTKANILRLEKAGFMWSFL